MNGLVKMKFMLYMGGIDQKYFYKKEATHALSNGIDFCAARRIGI